MSDTKAVFLSIILTPNDDGYLASVPGIQGAFAEGNTIEEAIFNCIDVVKMIMAYRIERGKKIRKGTVRAIIHEIGISVDEFMKP